MSFRGLTVTGSPDFDAVARESLDVQLHGDPRFRGMTNAEIEAGMTRVIEMVVARYDACEHEWGPLSMEVMGRRVPVTGLVGCAKCGLQESPDKAHAMG